MKRKKFPCGGDCFIVGSLKLKVKRLENIVNELADPMCDHESKDGKHLIVRSAFLDFERKLRYGYTVYKWDGTYNEKELSPVIKTKMKFKNWKECLHYTSHIKARNLELEIRKAVHLEEALNK